MLHVHVCNVNKPAAAVDGDTGSHEKLTCNWGTFLLHWYPHSNQTNHPPTHGPLHGILYHYSFPAVQSVMLSHAFHPEPGHARYSPASCSLATAEIETVKPFLECLICPEASKKTKIGHVEAGKQ